MIDWIAPGIPVCTGRYLYTQVGTPAVADHDKNLKPFETTLDPNLIYPQTKTILVCQLS